MSHVTDGLGVKRHLGGLRIERTPDPRDLLLTGGTGLKLPPTNKDRLAELPPVFDQGEIGSCTANMGCLVLSHAAQQQAAESMLIELARLDLYAETRTRAGTPLSDDSGCTIRETFSTMRAVGVCREELWPYIPAKFDIDPPAAADADAPKHRVHSFVRASGLHAIQAAIARGHILGFGIEVPEQMMSEEVARTGIVNFEPGQKIVGGHAVVCWGWETDDRGVLWLLCRNSWGQGWGIDGNFKLDHRFIQPAPYGQELAADFFYCTAVDVEV